MRRLIVGPSHVVRWEYGIRVGNIKKIENTDFYGCGGLPIWDEELMSHIASIHSNYDEIIILVGDFRFGNSFFVDNKVRYTGINKEQINLKNDTKLYKKSLIALGEFTKYSNVSFIFWDLAIREYSNKKQKKYTNDKIYKHPIWNLKHLEKVFSNNTLALDKLLKYDLDFLFIDSSLHPSLIGFSFLNKLIIDKEIISAYLKCLSLKKKINDYLYINEAIVICGTSKLFRFIMLYVQKGIIQLPENVQFSRADDALFCKRQDHRKLIFFTDSIEHHKLEQNKIYKEKAKWNSMVIFNSGVLEFNDCEVMHEITGEAPSAFFVISILKCLFTNSNSFSKDTFLPVYKNLIN